MRWLVCLLLSGAQAFVLPSLSSTTASTTELWSEATRTFDRYGTSARRPRDYPNRSWRDAGGGLRQRDWYDNDMYDRRGVVGRYGMGYRDGNTFSSDNPSTPLEGGSRRTFTSGFPYFSNDHEWVVNMETEGRPLNAEVEVRIVMI